jgi:3-carboxy-cis,cis-muconate cycloisomerase
MEAHRLVEHASREAVLSGRSLRDVLAAEPAVTRLIDDAQLDKLLDPANYVGSATRFVDAVLAEHARVAPAPDARP